MKRLLSLLCAAMLLACCLPASAEDAAELAAKTVTDDRPVIESVTSLETVTVPLYLEDTDTRSDLDLAIVNGIADVPYISLDAMLQVIDRIAVKEHLDGLEITVQREGNTIYWLRENASAVWFDFDADTITFSNYDSFFRTPGSPNALDMSSPAYANETGDVTLYTTERGLYRAGSTMIYLLGDYSIVSFLQDGTGYIPLQTFSDVFLSGFGLVSMYNGQCELICNSSLTDMTADGLVKTPMGELYYAAEKREKSEELTIFNYQELCMALDCTYGLMEEHSISSFDSLFRDTGLILSLKSRDAGDTYTALTELTMGYFADNHSGALETSYMTEKSTAISDSALADSVMRGRLQELPLAIARAKYYPQGVPGYEEVGNTAYITFDHFSWDPDRDYYNTEITNNSGDTIELLIYANRQISREDSPVENVVLDISLNGGGQVNTALCVMSWYIGYAQLNLVNTKTNAAANVIYQFDTNLDHQITADDCLHDLQAMKLGYHLYCLISGSSFSCGNMVPAYFKSTGCVTLIGRTSGGGACVVQPMSTADGCLFQISGAVRANTIKNGSYYSVDEGVAPDVYLDRDEHFYDRQYLTDLINNLD